MATMASDRRPVMVTGMARAGTSWVAEMLRAAGGFVHLNEPFNPKHPPGQCPGILRAPVDHMYLYVAGELEPVFQAALADTFRFRYHPIAELRRNRRAFDLAKMAKYWSAFVAGSLTGKRPLLDDPYASLSAEWIARTFDAQVAVIVRHPAAMVASYKRLGYRMDFRHLLDQPALMADWLEPYRADMQALVDGPEDRITQVALLWKVLHVALGGMAARCDRLHLTRYEDLSLDPEGAYGQLFATLGLEFNAAARTAVVEATSGSSRDKAHQWRLSRRGFLSRTAFRPMDSKANLSAWRSVVTPEELARIRAITEDVACRFYSDEEWDDPAAAAMRARFA
jgi:hypothetical protein